MPLYQNTAATRLLLDAKPNMRGRLHYSCEPAGSKTGGGVPCDWLDVADGHEKLPGIASAIESGALIPYAGLSTDDVKAASVKTPEPVVHTPAAEVTGAPTDAMVAAAAEQKAEPVADAVVDTPVVETPAEETTEGGDRHNRRNRHNR